MSTEAPQKRRERADSDYATGALMKGLQVLEALEGTRFEPVSVQRIAERTRLPYDTCWRALRTLKVKGFVAETEQGWTLSTRYIAFCRRAAEARNDA